MATTDLCTLAQVKAWVPKVPTGGEDDTLIKGLITSMSNAVTAALNRQSCLLSRTFTDYYDGWGDAKKMLRNWPVTSVSAVAVDTASIQLATGNAVGFLLQPWDGSLPGMPQMVALRGRTYTPGTQNVAITYQAGYLIASEAQTIPATPFQITVDQPSGPWAENASVINANTGVALTKIASGTPAAGQYTVAAGVYQFAAADTGIPVLISYSFIPAPLNQGACEMVGEAYVYRGRIGHRSQTIPGPQTMAFDLSRMTAAIQVLIQQYNMVVPIV